MPFIIVMGFGFLYYYLGWAFFAGFGVFALAFIMNALIGIYINNAQKNVMSKKDDRMNETTQAINNIKMLKLYSWQTLFQNKILDKRSKEISALKKQLYAVSGLIAGNYFFPQMMPAVCFTAYIGFDIQPALDLPIATTCLIFFQLISGPMVWVPLAISDFIQLTVSMKRV